MNLARRRANSLSSPGTHPTGSTSPTYSYRVDADPRETSLVGALCDQLSLWGVEEAYGVSGGAIALLFDALSESSINLRHFRHETGAAFGACEAYFASGRPSVVFATTGPGLLNALTGLTAARWDGAKVILISGHTNTAQRGRWATQETSSYTLPQDALYSKGTIFDFAVRMESSSELPTVLQRIAAGLARPGSFIAHICLPMSVQSSHLRRAATELPPSSSPSIAEADVTEIASLLRREGFVIWAGFGATDAAPLVRELVERSGAKIFCSPRAKGLIAENHPNYLGVTGIGGHEAVAEFMVQERPRRTLVLGTRLGEATSFWDRDLLPSEGLVHVDLDPEVPGCSFPDFPTFGVQAEIKGFLEALLRHFPARKTRPPVSNVVPFKEPSSGPQQRSSGPVRPQALLESMQRLVIDQSDATVLAECGNSFAWTTHYLRFDQPGRYRVSTLFGSMGHTAAGVVGAALASGKKTVAVVGDGAMLMNCEVSTAVQYGAKAVWIVLNDSGYGMCRDGHRALGVSDNGTSFPSVDFVDWARSMGADGARIETEDMLDVALGEALNANCPFVLDVRIDTREASPLLRRFESLISQGGSKNVAGWAR